MADIVRQKKEYALCNSAMEPKLLFGSEDSMRRWVDNQIALHGKVPNLVPCCVTTHIEVEMLV